MLMAEEPPAALSRRGYSSSTWRLTILMTGKRIFTSAVLFHPSHIAAHMFCSTTPHSHIHIFSFSTCSPLRSHGWGYWTLHTLFVFGLVAHLHLRSQSCIIPFGGCINISSITVALSSFDNRKKTFNLLRLGVRPLTISGRVTLSLLRILPLLRGQRFLHST